MPEGEEGQRPQEQQKEERADEESLVSALKKDASRLSDEEIQQRLIDSGIAAERASELTQHQGSLSEFPRRSTAQEQQQDFDRAERHFNAALSRARMERPDRPRDSEHVSTADQSHEDQSSSDEGDR